MNCSLVLEKKIIIILSLYIVTFLIEISNWLIVNLNNGKEEIKSDEDSLKKKRHR
jgi:hypothetical protein